MALRLPYADHLINEEVDYELTIRGKGEETNNDVEAKYRMLRYLFKEDEKEGRVYESPFTIDQEYDIICSRVGELRNKLANGLDDRTFSRLKHYYGIVYRIMTKDADSERMRKELLQDIRVELNKFEGRKEQEKRPDPFNFEGDGKSSRNGAKPKGQVEPNLNQDSRTEAPVEANGLQVQPSERERALEAQVKELQRKVEMLLSQSEGAKGGNGESGSENGNLAGRYGSSERYAGSESSGKYPNRHGKTEATTRQSPSSHSSRQKDLDRNVALGNEVNDRDRQKLERCGYYQQDDRNPGISDDRVMQRENRFSQGNERNGSWDRQRNRLDSYRTRDERAMRRSDGTFFVGNRQLQREREQEQYRMREPWRDDIAHDTEADMGRNEYRDQRRSERMRNERWGNPYDGNQSDRSWRQQRGGYREADQRRSGENATRHWNRRPDESPRPFAGGEPQMVFSSDEFSEDERRWNRREQEPVRNVRRINEAEIRDADRRMEKWHVSFSGDARSRSLEDFLLKVRRLAKMDRIADDVLMQRIHTILRGEAYDWYLCYADEFNDWKQCSTQIAAKSFPVFCFVPWLRKQTA